MWGSQSDVAEDSRLRNVTLCRLLEGITIFWNNAATLSGTLGIFSISKLYLAWKLCGHCVF
jgi:hypothetical protein